MPLTLAADPAESMPAGAGELGEFEFAASDFQRVRALIRARAGIHLQDGKQAMVYSRLSRRLRETGHRSFSEYLRMLESAQGAAADSEWEQFVNCLTTNLTSFFREQHHFDALAEALRARPPSAALRIWCTAASTGEEPYTLAMVASEVLGSRADARILATDIDTTVLDTARRATYPADARGLSPERLRAHCLRGKGANEGLIRMRPELTRMVDLQPFNLMNDPRSLPGPFDMVFCRNVMIYFDAATQRSVLERLHSVMKPSGLLFVGHSENFADARLLFRLRGKTIYERL